MTRDLLVYVSAPYSSDPERNTLAAMDLADEIEDAGLLVVLPHLSHFRHQRKPRDYRHWMRLDLALLRKCDVMVRARGYSPGADEEEIEARSLGIPVFFSVDDLLAWAEGRAA